MLFGINLYLYLYLQQTLLGMSRIAKEYPGMSQTPTPIPNHNPTTNPNPNPNLTLLGVTQHSGADQGPAEKVAS